MEHNHSNKNLEIKNYTLKNFIPLIVIFCIILLFTIIRQLYSGWNFESAMYDFMGAFFIVFGSFKIINWPGFVEAYRTYDIVAKYSKAYAYIYPLIELGLGISYLMRYQLFYTNLITLILMIVSSIGVAQELLKGRRIVCACLGAVFRLPMTYVTLAEDLLMATMAAIMLFVQKG